MTICPMCGAEVPDYATTCPMCGAELTAYNSAPTSSRRGRKPKRGVGGKILGVFLAAAVLIAAGAVGIPALTRSISRRGEDKAAAVESKPKKNTETHESGHKTSEVEETFEPRDTTPEEPSVTVQQPEESHEPPEVEPEPETAAPETEIDARFCGFYATLSVNEQSVYYEMYQQLAEGADSFEIQLPQGVDADRVSDLYEMVLADNPELFWPTGRCQFVQTIVGGITTSITISPEIYPELQGNLASCRRAFEENLQYFLNGTEGLEPPMQEAVVLRNIAENVDYQLDAAMNQSAYSALVLRESVCSGYAKAFQCLMRRLGIPCFYLSGDEHAWSIIELDGEYYEADATWADPVSEDGAPNDVPSYKYYNLTTAEMSIDHTREGLCLNLPIAYGEKYTFENVFGYPLDLFSYVNEYGSLPVLFDDSMSAADYIVSEAVQQGRTFTVTFGIRAGAAADSVVDNNYWNDVLQPRIVEAFGITEGSFEIGMSWHPGESYYIVTYEVKIS